MRLHGEAIPESDEKRFKINLVNMVYKLLPIREESKDWGSYLDSLILELTGFMRGFNTEDSLLYMRILSKLEGMKDLTKEDDFKLYRKTVLECTNLIK